MKKAILYISALILVVGCVKPNTKDSLLAESDINKSKTISILSEYFVETKFSKCVKKGLKADIQNLNIISQNEFRDALFPWFERSTAPKNVEELSILLNKSAIRERINKLGVDAVINVSGKTIQEKWQGPGVGGYGAAVGYAYSDQITYMTATVCDLKAKTIFATNKNTIGTDHLIIIGLPIYIPASTESSACNEIVNRISDYLQNKDSPK